MTNSRPVGLALLAAAALLHVDGGSPVRAQAVAAPAAQTRVAEAINLPGRAPVRWSGA